ncbi:MAG: hypothetical protein KBD16_03180 [Candidatus Pacebacteria bacterium]|nr:hypothetical protein [Candidatus Paceibacterota bacterium]
MSKIQKLLSGRHDDKIEYTQIIEKHPWIVEKGHKAILSPDSDGLLCGLLMSHYLDWTIEGFYDGKVMLLKKGVDPKDCIFLDMEIARPEIRSMGHHMLLLNRNSKPTDWETKFKNCIQPNNLRGYDGKHDFRLKYPLATIHMLMCILNEKERILLKEESIPPLYFTDGVFNVLFKYPENVLNWLNFLDSQKKENPLNPIFENEKYTTIINLMKEMDAFFRLRDAMSIPYERGDRLKISSKDGQPFNVEGSNDSYKINDAAVERILKFLELLSSSTGWGLKKQSWAWSNLKLFKFTKGSFEKDGKTLTKQNFKDFWEKNPLSWAMTSGTNIEYTLEGPDTLA